MPLSVLIWLPVATALIGALAGARLAPRVALLGALATLGIAIALLVDFDRGAAGLQQLTDETWISELGIHYKLGIDGLNVALIVLTALLWASAVLWANLRPWERPRLFFFQLALGETAVLGAFCAQDLALFVGFFDLMLIPFYFLVGTWGGQDRIRATTKLVIYTLVGSLFMLAAAIATAVLARPPDGELTFVLSELRELPLSEGSQDWIFLCFAAAFLVKMPAFPVHGWAPDAYRAMPLPVLAVFSAVLSKVAAYGFLRIVLPTFPDASVHFQMLLLLIGLASILYGSAMAFTQTNARLILAYSSIAQLGFITLGIFSLRPDGAQGALFQAVNHGLVVAPLFFIVALLAARAGGSEDIRDMGGIALRAPVLAGMFLIVALATLAMPGSANFVGEFLILLGVFQAKIVIAIVASAGVVLAAVYVLRAFIRTMHNRVGKAVVSADMSFSDGLVLVPLVLVIIGLSLYPQIALERSEAAVTGYVKPAQDIAQPPEAPVEPASQPQPGGAVPPDQGGAIAPDAGGGAVPVPVPDQGGAAPPDAGGGAVPVPEGATP